MSQLVIANLLQLVIEIQTRTLGISRVACAKPETFHRRAQVFSDFRILRMSRSYRRVDRDVRQSEAIITRLKMIEKL